MKGGQLIRKRTLFVLFLTKGRLPRRTVVCRGQIWSPISRFSTADCPPDNVPSYCHTRERDFQTFSVRKFVRHRSCPQRTVVRSTNFKFNFKLPAPAGLSSTFGQRKKFENRKNRVNAIIPWTVRRTKLKFGGAHS